MWETFITGARLQSTYTVGGRVILNQNIRMSQCESYAVNVPYAGFPERH
jgi:hypothetical protein